MLYLKKIKLLKEYRNLKPFCLCLREGLNIVVGENGSGKSTLLSLVVKESDKDLVELDFQKEAQYQFLDTEKQNPRIKASTMFSKNIAFDISSRFMSHGQAMLFLLEGAKDFKDILLIIDEPEAGLSLKNQKNILDILKNLIKDSNCQVLLSTHSYPFIKSVEEIFCMDIMKWIKSEDFLKGI
jgi:predicted ATPase